MNFRCTLFAALLTCVPLALPAQDFFDVALLGDMPYGSATAPNVFDAAYERVISDINIHSPQFSVFIGDTKSGSTRCDNSHYTQALNWFNSFESALIYSVGDNEWTDCMRANNGSYDPMDRLSLIRRTFFPTNMSLGQNPIRLIRQSDDSEYALYRENAMWVRGPVVFVTVHIPGSNNNLEYRTVQGAANPFYDNDREYAARNAANLAWTRRAFALAKERGAYGVMILTQANIFETYLSTETGSTRSGFEDYVALLREEAAGFDGDIAFIHGDSHYARIDKPLTSTYPPCPATNANCRPDNAGGVRFYNFTRVEVPGQNDVHWVRARIMPVKGRVFQFEVMIVQKNR